MILPLSMLLVFVNVLKFSQRCMLQISYSVDHDGSSQLDKYQFRLVEFML